MICVLQTASLPLHDISACVSLGSVSTVFNQANLHSTSLNNVDGQCEILAMARYDKTGMVLL